MRYAQHRSRFRKGGARKAKSSKPWKFIVAFGVLVAVIATWFILKKPNTPPQEVVAESAEEGVGEGEEIAVFGENLHFEEIDIFFNASGFDAGFARRNIEDGVFTHVIVADLPMIDLTVNYYEAWLVRPGVTEYFSTGEMFAREDGKFGLVWEQNLDEAQTDLFRFTRVVITREARDGDPSPAPTHVAEGEF